MDMGFVETAIIYGIIGLAVAVAMMLREAKAGVVSLLPAFLFWPFYAPILLAGSAPARAPRSGSGAAIDTRIRAAEERVLAALSRVDAVAEEVLAPEVSRIRAIADAMIGMSTRLAEMDELLATPELDRSRAEAALRDLSSRGVGDEDPRARSVRARLRNVERLAVMRASTGDNLERALIELEGMAAQLALLKFAGQSDAEVVERVRRISAGVEELTAVLV
jgi:hypothetical protein